MKSLLLSFGILTSTALAAESAPEGAVHLRKFSDPDWLVREAASADLIALGRPAIPLLAAEYRRSADAEVRTRITSAAHEIFWRNVAGFLGVSMMAVGQFDEEARGVYIRDVLPDTSAAKAGIRAGDIIVEFAGVDLSTAQIPEFSRLVLGRGVGVPTKVIVIRDRRRVALEVALGALPDREVEKKLDSLDDAELELFVGWWHSLLKQNVVR